MRQFYGRLAKNASVLQENFHVRKSPSFRGGGGILGFAGGGGSADFIFMGAGIFLIFGVPGTFSRFFRHFGLEGPERPL